MDERGVFLVVIKRLVSAALVTALLILMSPLYSFAYKDDATFGETPVLYAGDSGEPKEDINAEDTSGDAETHDTDDRAGLDISDGNKQSSKPDEAPQQDEALGQMDLTHTDDTPELSVRLPASLDFTIDPFEVAGRGQVYSEGHVFENLGDSAVIVVFTDISLTFAEGVSNIALRQEPFTGGPGWGENELCLLLDFGRSEIGPIIATAPFVEPIAVPLNAHGDESGLSIFALCISGSVGFDYAQGWGPGDVGLSVTIEIETLDEYSSESIDEESNTGTAAGQLAEDSGQLTQEGRELTEDEGLDDAGVPDDGRGLDDAGDLDNAKGLDDTWLQSDAKSIEDTANPDNAEGLGDAGVQSDTKGLEDAEDQHGTGHPYGTEDPDIACGAGEGDGEPEANINNGDVDD